MSDRAQLQLGKGERTYLIIHRHTKAVHLLNFIHGYQDFYTKHSSSLKGGITTARIEKRYAIIISHHTIKPPPARSVSSRSSLGGGTRIKRRVRRENKRRKRRKYARTRKRQQKIKRLTQEQRPYRKHHTPSPCPKSPLPYHTEDRARRQSRHCSCSTGNKASHRRNRQTGAARTRTCTSALGHRWPGSVCRLRTLP